MQSLSLKAFMIGLDDVPSLDNKVAPGSNWNLKLWLDKNKNTKLADLQEYIELADAYEKYETSFKHIINSTLSSDTDNAKEEFKNLDNISDTLLYLLTEIEKQVTIE